MESAEEIYDSLRSSPNLPTFKDWALAAMREYAAQAITAQLEVAAKEAQVESETPLGAWHPVYTVDPESITSCTRIELP